MTARKTPPTANRRRAPRPSAPTAPALDPRLEEIRALAAKLVSQYSATDKARRGLSLLLDADLTLPENLRRAHALLAEWSVDAIRICGDLDVKVAPVLTLIKQYLSAVHWLEFETGWMSYALRGAPANPIDTPLPVVMDALKDLNEPDTMKPAELLAGRIQAVGECLIDRLLGQRPEGLAPRVSDPDECVDENRLSIAVMCAEITEHSEALASVIHYNLLAEEDGAEEEGKPLDADLRWLKVNIEDLLRQHGYQVSEIGNFRKAPPAAPPASVPQAASDAWREFTDRFYEFQAAGRALGASKNFDSLPTMEEWHQLTYEVYALRRQAREILTAFEAWSDVRPHGPVR